MAEVWPLVGRHDELAYVVQALEDRQGVLLAGAPGVGKSRLAAEAVEAACGRGWEAVALTAGPESAAVPFSPFSPLLGEDASGDGVDRFLRVDRALERRGERVVLWIDDAHHLDDVSTAFVRHLLGTNRVRLLLTVRSEVPIPDALAGAWRSGQLQRIELQPLARHEVEELLVQALGGPVDLPTQRWVWRVSGGNALFVRELVLDAIERGGLAERNGRWTSTTSVQRPGARLSEVVAARIGTISTPAHEALELLAVGQPLGLELFEELAGSAAAQELERGGLVRSTRRGLRTEVEVAHPIHAEVLRSRMGPSTARQRRRQLIGAISDLGANRVDDALRLAVWRIEVGETDDWRSLLDAAKHLTKAFERPLVTLWTGGKDLDDVAPIGRGHLDLALQLAQTAHGTRPSIESAAVISGLLARLGRLDEAVALDTTVESLVADDADRLAIARMRADAALFHGQDVDRPLAELVDIEQTTSDPVIRVGARATRAQLLAFKRHALSEAIDIALDVIDDPHASTLERTGGASVAAIALAETGRGRDGIDLIDGAIAGIGPTDDSTLMGLLMCVRIVVLDLAGRYAEAEQLATLGLQVSQAAGSDEGAAVFATALGHVCLSQGRAADAAHWASEVTGHVAVVDLLGTRRLAIAAGTMAHALLGHVDDAEQGVKVLDAERPQKWSDDDEVRAHAWTDVAAGRVTSALARLEAAAERARVDGRSTRELLMLHDIARLGHARVVRDRVDEVGAMVDADTTTAIVEHVRGLATRDPALLASAAARFESLGAHLWEAEAWAQAAVALEAEGKRSSAASAATRSRAAADLCQGASTPALAIGGAATQLTTREREIADLAARGLSDKEIATELVISARTVQSHLYNVYAKLGVEGRASLADVLGS